MQRVPQTSPFRSTVRPRPTCGRGVPALVAAVLAAGLAACGTGDGATSRDTVPPAVEAVAARSGALPLEERLSGLVRARNQVAIRAEIAAPIVEVLARNGDAVQRGQVLVRLDSDGPRERLRQAEASLRLAEAAAAEAQARRAELQAQVSRNRELARQQLISELDLETQEARLAAAEASTDQGSARVEQARATVEERRAELAKTVVRSPVTGRVGDRDAEVGMLVDPGDLLFVVGDLDDLIVEVPLTERMLGYLRAGQPVLVARDTAGADAIRATLSRISPFLEPGSFSTIGEIDLPATGDRLRPGMFVTVDVLYGETERATLVPASALWQDPRTGIDGVYLVKLSSAAAPSEHSLSEETYPVEFRPIEVLAAGRGTLGIGGVAEGDWVVTIGQHLLRSDRDSSVRLRATTWERVLELQGMQREDLLDGFLREQRRLARELGADPPATTAYLASAAR